MIIEYHKCKIFRSGTEKIIFGYKAQIAAAGVIRLLFTWLLDGTPLPAEEVIKLAKNTLYTSFNFKKEIFES